MIYLYSIAASFVWVHVLGSPKLPFKPFTCDVCLSGWVAMVLSWTAGNIWQVPFDGAVAMVGMIGLKKILKVN
jgi:hypothetical protein